ncbi:DUF4350 domain-containing protein [Hymenobacter properus]|uniref:DUF4350 domain-containing protein n=1 Tax=Hymenobacter properus TaxID=2791026 RepID=A0A931FJR9_9BACT|nr:DUF4350 domain-containing protein [Hymenobacter properus]MBF9142198.1 hypothetical protein [Hymenobacter properus]MBR7721005.1 hypothetical protein [Microvirga sp. SRT04]
MPQLTTFRLYLLGVALLFAGYVTLEYNRPKPLDWSPTYSNKDKIPYGTYVLYDQLPRLLGTDSVETVRLPVYSQLTGLTYDDAAPDPRMRRVEDGVRQAMREAHEAHTANETEAATATSDSATVAATPAADTAAADSNSSVADNETEEADTTAAAADSTTTTVAEEQWDEDEEEEAAGALPLRAGPANYLFVNEGFDLGRLDARALLQYVARGNNAFVAAKYFRSQRGLLRDSLGFRIKELAPVTTKGYKGIFATDSVELRFTNPALASAHIRLPGTSVEQYLEVDSGRVGRTLATDARGHAVFVRIDYGRGHFYLCTAPVAFTNFYLLKPRKAAFAEAALRYLPVRRAWWDEYMKQGPVGEQSLLRVVFAHDALRWAYYLCLFGGLLFVLIEARRRQRIIPTIKPLPNTTLLFTRTVASLYRQGSNHALIAEKKVALFLDYLRHRFQETNPDFADADFRERLSQKSGLARTRVDELLRLVNFARTAPQMTDQQLMQLSKALSDFKREAGR